MILNLHDSRGKEIDIVQLDIESIIGEAERSGDDPLLQTGAIISEQLLYRGFEVASDSLSKFLRVLGNSLATGNLPTQHIMIGHKTKKPTADANSSASGQAGMLLNKTLDVFQGVLEYPNERAESIYRDLVGLDDIKERLAKESSLLLAPEKLVEWSKKHNRKILAACQAFEKRLPLIVFAGDIGTGKTALAESFGNEVAKFLKTKMLLLRLSVQTRGSGLVGEMTQLINKAFREAGRISEERKGPVILLIDEADTLAQSREASQMHHEDRAGVNALIQGIDYSKELTYPILIVFCTNRIGAVDPAILRRAAIIHHFLRPTEEHLKAVYKNYFGDMGLDSKEIDQLVVESLPSKSREHGFTYSDIINKVIPSSLMRAYPDRALTYEDVLETVRTTVATPPFMERSSNGT